MKKQYNQLESVMVKYKDLINIRVKENNERMIFINRKELSFGYLKEMNDMEKIMQGRIAVRENVYKRLLEAQKKLKKLNRNLSLFITYGYRSYKIQKKLFLERLKESCQQFRANPFNLYELVHRQVAVPSVAGHPTGGAVDLLIINEKTNEFLDFGSKIYDFSNKDSYFFSPYISGNARKNRNLLRLVMSKASFAPYNGEWWHYSYGDKEWAFYYKKEYAIYDLLTFNKVILKLF